GERLALDGDREQEATAPPGPGVPGDELGPALGRHQGEGGDQAGSECDSGLHRIAPLRGSSRGDLDGRRAGTREPPWRGGRIPPRPGMPRGAPTGPHRPSGPTRHDGPDGRSGGAPRPAPRRRSQASPSPTPSPIRTKEPGSGTDSTGANANP